MAEEQKECWKKYKGKGPNKKLIPLTDRDPEEAFAIRSKGGKARAEKARKQRTIREIAELILKSKPSKKIASKLKKELPGMNDEEINYKLAMVFGQVRSAMDGNTFAFKQLQDTIGEGVEDSGKSEDKIDKFFEALEEGFENEA